VAKYKEALADDEVKKLCREVLTARKGQAHGYAAHLIRFCPGLQELPTTLTEILEAIHNALSSPPPPPPGDGDQPEADGEGTEDP